MKESRRHDAAENQEERRGGYGRQLKSNLHPVIIPHLFTRDGCEEQRAQTFLLRETQNISLNCSAVGSG